MSSESKGTEKMTITSVAKECAWPYGTPRKTYTYPTGKPTEAYKKNLDKAYPDRSKWGKQTRAGASCDVFVGTVVRASGTDKKYPRGLEDQIEYLKVSKEWTKAKVNSYKDLRAGDIIVYTKKKGGGHTCIYVGDDHICEAGYNSKRYGCTAKLYHFSNTYIKNTYSFFGVYRKANFANKGIDISNHQGVVSAKTFDSMGYEKIILRSSLTFQQMAFKMEEDKAFDSNIRNAYAANKKIGIYHYSQARTMTEARKEAEFVVKTITPYKKMITLPVAFDYEFSGGRFNAAYAKNIGKYGLLDICNAFCQVIKSAGFTPMVYANLSTLNGYIAPLLPDLWPVWVAQYNSKCDYKKPFYIWQYSSTGRVSGLTGTIDMDQFYSMPKTRAGKKYTGKYPVLPKRGWFQIGDKGEQVKLMQKLLIWAGYSCGKSGADGEFGKNTKSAVINFERGHSLDPDGGFGTKCLQKAKELIR